jgi:hypothetical protein
MIIFRVCHPSPTFYIGVGNFDPPLKKLECSYKSFCSSVKLCQPRHAVPTVVHLSLFHFSLDKARFFEISYHAKSIKSKHIVNLPSILQNFHHMQPSRHYVVLTHRDTRHHHSTGATR